MWETQANCLDEEFDIDLYASCYPYIVVHPTDAQSKCQPMVVQMKYDTEANDGNNGSKAALFTFGFTLFFQWSFPI